ncbi:MAG: hypothetical protein ACJ8D9_05485, partial [Xanthobacteraceae bacterium]
LAFDPDGATVACAVDFHALDPFASSSAHEACEKWASRGLGYPQAGQQKYEAQQATPSTVEKIARPCRNVPSWFVLAVNAKLEEPGDVPFPNRCRSSYSWQNPGGRIGRHHRLGHGRRCRMAG